MPGLYLEEFEVGRVFQHQLRKTVTESDNMLFSVMTLNPQPLHIDFDFAAKTEWGKPLVNSLFTLGLMIGISVHDTTLGTTVANLGMTDTVFPHPVFHGDTIRVETEVKSIRESKSRPDRGIVEFEHRAFNQDGLLVAKTIRQAMIRKKAS
jgi:acyl dehydratase